MIILPQRLRDYLTVGEAAEYLGVSASTLRNWDRAGKVQAIRHPVNGYRLYRKEELANLLEKVHDGPDRNAGV
jgi:excisionase family DNA binding protein